MHAYDDADCVPFDALAAEGESWPEIDSSLLEDRRAAVPAFPLALLPLEWERWVADTAQSAGTAADYVAQALLAAVAAICGAGVSVRVTPAWHEPLVLWQALVGTPSSGKSPALAAVRRQVDAVEQDRRDGDADRRARHALDIEEGRDAGAFVPSQIVVSDSTMEALADVVSGNPRGVVLWRDELSAWLANLDRYANGGSDGMAARFLYVWPELPDYTPLMDRRIPRDDDALAMLQKIARVAGMPGSPLVLGFDSEALALFDQFAGDLHRTARSADGLEAGWLGKGPGTVARLAAVLALLHWSQRDSELVPFGPIGRELAMHAIGLWSGYFRKHAAAVFNQAGRTDRDRDARRVVRWLLTSGAEEVSRESIRREALAHAVDAEGADRVIARLEAGGVLRLVPMVKGRGRPARRWSVNPAVAA